MPVPEGRLQELILAKDTEEALAWMEDDDYEESWAIIDGSLVIYDGKSPPWWLEPVLVDMDEDGSTT